MKKFYFLAALWYFIGVHSFIYWQTKIYDIRVSNMPLILLCGISGPITYIVGWSLHGEPLDLNKYNIIIFKKNNQ